MRRALIVTALLAGLPASGCMQAPQDVGSSAVANGDTGSSATAHQDAAQQITLQADNNAQLKRRTHAVAPAHYDLEIEGEDGYYNKQQLEGDQLDYLDTGLSENMAYQHRGSTYDQNDHLPRPYVSPDISLSENMAYQHRDSAYDQNDNLSRTSVSPDTGPSTVAHGETGSSATANRAATLDITLQAGNSAKLLWPANPVTPAYYDLEIEGEDGFYNNQRLEGDQLDYLDIGLSKNVTYQYKVSAYDQDDNLLQTHVSSARINLYTNTGDDGAG